MIEKKTYRNGKPYKYSITINKTRYNYYGGKIVYCKNIDSYLYNHELDLETGEHYIPVHTTNDPNWPEIRDKFKNFQ